MKGRLPVTVVAGARGSGKSRLIAQLRAKRPAAERWALLSNSAADSMAGDPSILASSARGVPDVPDVPADQFFTVSGGCACCVASLVFRTTLTRLLRAGPWGRLLIEVDATGHPHALVDQLRAPPFDHYLEVTCLLLTLRDSDVSLYQSHPDPLGAAAGLGFATHFLLQVATDPVASTAAWLEAAAPWPRLEQVAVNPGSATDTGLPPDLTGWRVFSALQPSDRPENFDRVRQWPARCSGLRRELKNVLSTLATDSSVAGFQALLRTPRAWYCWRFGRGRGIGALAFKEGAELLETETSWRFDNRLCLWLRPRARRDAVDARLQDLDEALQRADS